MQVSKNSVITAAAAALVTGVEARVRAQDCPSGCAILNSRCGTEGECKMMLAFFGIMAIIATGLIIYFVCIKK